jgi:hypothetical protein
VTPAEGSLTFREVAPEAGRLNKLDWPGGLEPSVRVCFVISTSVELSTTSSSFNRSTSRLSPSGCSGLLTALPSPVPPLALSDNHRYIQLES